MFAGFWPGATVDEQIVADKLNSIPKTVCSNSLKEAPWGNWPPATILRGDAVKEVKALKNEAGKDIVLWGSIALSHALIDADLIDEYQLRIVPVILGDGIMQFRRTSRRKLRLTGTKQYRSGLLFVTYRPG
jgi:dihydrofolate reductase